MQRRQSAWSRCQGLADEKETITFHLEIHNCLIRANGFGLLVKLLPAHIEIEETGLLFDITGNLVGEVTPEGTPPTKNWNLVFKQAAGVQAIERCEGGEAETLLTSEDGNANVQSGLEAKEFHMEFEKAAQEAMF